MITKARLLAGLNEMIYVEEGMVGVYVNFSKAMVNQTEGMPEDRKKHINKLLTKLIKDSSEHKKKVQDLITFVEKDKRDGF